MPVEIENVDVPTPCVEWLKVAHVDANEVISMPKKHAPRADAKAFLKDFLSGEPRDASAVYAAAAAEGISVRTLDRAKSELAVESRKKGTEGWKWVLPDGQPKGVRQGQEGYGTLGTLHAVAMGD